MFLIVIAFLGIVILKDMIVDQLPDYILHKLNKTCQFKSV
jgi:hypothetical protein